MCVLADSGCLELESGLSGDVEIPWETTSILTELGVMIFWIACFCDSPNSGLVFLIGGLNALLKFEEFQGSKLARIAEPL